MLVSGGKREEGGRHIFTPNFLISKGFKTDIFYFLRFNREC